MQLAVPFQQVLTPHQFRQIGHPGDVEEDLHRAVQERHQIEQLDAHLTQDPGNRNRQQQGQTNEVGHDHQAPPPDPVDPDPGDQAEDQIGRGAGRGQKTHLSLVRH